MIQWKKMGIVFQASMHGKSWMANSALTPTPIALNEDVIRIFAGFRDDAGISRIGYVDVMSNDPQTIVGVSQEPVIELGRDGCFDDNGMILGDVIRRPEGIYMFYVGFQLVAKVKFLAFSGLAFSKDNGETFTRMSDAPILGRGPGQTTIGAIHSVRFENSQWRIWYASGDGWEYINGKPFPQYHIRYVETDNLLEMPRTGSVCVNVKGDEYRIGRPRVYFIDGRYVMYYTKGTTTGEYFPGIAYSHDGVNWERCDKDLGIALSADGWDSKTLCYPALINSKERLYMFYNGNNMGVDGFGYAETSGVQLT
jgi:hypothetical protein